MQEERRSGWRNVGFGLRCRLQQLRAQRPAMLVRKLLMRALPGAARALMTRRFEPQSWERRNRRAREIAARAKPLVELQEAVVHGLQRNGVAIGPCTSLVEDETIEWEARLAALACLSRPGVARQIERRWSSSGAKWYVVRALGLGAGGTIPDGLARLVLNRRLLGVINRYLGAAARLHYVDVWHNFPVRAEEPGISAERWHRDHEDIRIVKVALFLDDVCPDSGPLRYVRGSQPGGTLGDFHPAVPSIGAHPPAAEVESLIALGNVEVCTGRRGDLLLWDGVGLHHGGRAHSRPRRLALAYYASDAAVDGRRYSASESVARGLDEAGRYALRLDPSAR